MPEENTVDQLMDEALAATVQKDEQAAMSIYEELSKKLPDENARKFNLAIIYRALADQFFVDEPDKSMSYYKEAIALDPSQKLSNYYYAILLANKGDIKEAIDHFRNELNLDINNSDVYFQMAGALNKNGEIEAAIENYKKSAALDNSKYTLAYNQIGYIYWVLEDYQDALGAFTTTLSKDPNDLYALEMIANCYKMLKESGLALKFLNRILHLKNQIKDQPQATDYEKKLPTIYNTIGNVYFDLKQDMQKAIDAYQEGLKLDKNNFYLLQNLGVAYSRQSNQKVNKGIAILQKILEPAYKENFEEYPIEEKKRLATVCNDLGYVYLMSKNDPDKAIELYEKALKLDPYNFIALRNLSYARSRQKNPNLEKVIEPLSIILNPDNRPEIEISIGKNNVNYKLAEIYNSLGNIYLDQLSDYSMAKGNYRKALALSPDFVYATRNLGLAYERTGDVATAEKFYKEAIENDKSGKFLDPIFDLGYINDSRYEYDEALAKYLEVLEKSKNKNNGLSDIANHNISIIYSKKGMYVESYKCFAEAKRLYQLKIEELEKEQ